MQNRKEFWCFWETRPSIRGGGFTAFLFLAAYSGLIWMLSAVLRWLRSKGIFVLVILTAVIPLFAVKYTGMLVESINRWFHYQLVPPGILLPMGISFFTFEAVSLLVDVYTNKLDEKISLAQVYLYLTFFPTVTSGPLIRFGDFKKGLTKSFDTAAWGSAIERIVTGLSKKLLVADKAAILADYYFDGIAAGNTYSIAGLWIGSFAYTIQLYFDFSGYSDMAIGLGEVMGFHIDENFNKPYQASSISDFWRRWHISLSRWFRDYVYIPLGGNKCAVPRHIFNLLIVWLLTGIWHGADWTFVLWGLGYFVLLAVEKYAPFISKIKPYWISHVYVLFFVNLLWVPFRAEGLRAAGKYICGMFGGGKGTLEDKAISFIPFLGVAALLCFSWERWIAPFRQKRWFKMLRGTVIAALAFLSVCAAVNSSYTPYIYGKF